MYALDSASSTSTSIACSSCCCRVEINITSLQNRCSINCLPFDLINSFLNHIYVCLCLFCFVLSAAILTLSKSCYRRLSFCIDRTISSNSIIQIKVCTACSALGPIQLSTKFNGKAINSTLNFDNSTFTLLFVIAIAHLERIKLFFVSKTMYFW
jgi:hypothetical protein